jgi:hypothetical protein
LIKSHGGNAGQQRQADDAMRGWDQQHNWKNIPIM